MNETKGHLSNNTKQQQRTMRSLPSVAARDDYHRGAGGRIGRLAHHRQTPIDGGPIQIMIDATANDIDWFARYSALFDRHVGQGDPLDLCAQELGMTACLAASLVGRLGSLQDNDVGRSLVPSLCSNLKTVPMTKQDARYQEACEIGRSIITRVARKDPKFLREVALIYGHAVHKRMHIVMTGVDDAYLGRALIELVKLIGLPQLGIRLTGYRIGDRCSDVASWLKILGLPPDAPVHWVSAPNQNSSASLGHCGVEVVRDDGKGNVRVSGAFHNVMILAAVVEIWRLPFTTKLTKSKDRSSLDPLPLFDGHHAESE